MGGQQHFSVKIDPLLDSDVTWRIQEGDAGGSISGDGVYTAPARPGTYHVIATNPSDPSRNAAAAVTVISQGSVRVSPANRYLGPGGEEHFTAEVTEAPDKAIVWSVMEQNGGSISERGDYIAPTAAGTYHVVATGRSDASLEGTTTVTVSSLLPKGVICNVSPRLPYLAWVSSRAAVIGWRCNPNGSVHWGEGQGRNHTFVDTSGKDQHFAVLTDLSPGTTYSYEAEIDGKRLGEAATFTTAPAEGSEASFIAFADSGSGSVHQKRLAEVMKRVSFDFALIAGDVIYDKGADADYDPRYFRPYGEMIKRLPFFPVPGNHDVVTESGGPFRRNFYLPKGNFYYDFFWGEIHVIGLDSNRVSDRRQKEWLETALKAPARWTIVYFHHPAFSSAEYGDTPSVQAEWVPLFERYGVDLVINGHAHGYERTVPINGVTYIVTGGGGAPLYPVGRNERTVISSSTYEFLSVDVTADSMVLKTVDEAGNVIDQFQIDKPDQTDGAPIP
ncbi:MAG: metallophosphoesterase family protein [Candidatus Manganitrophus sp.]|nr:metallophosphoesterase family protein [Candidatus Manganitrophus sp.]